MGQCRAWPDGDDASCPPFLTWAEARQAAPHGVRFGSHTLSHPDLTALASAEVERELVESRRLIEDQTGQPAATFSYPFGRQTPRLREQVREAGYRLACAGPVGYVGAAGGDRFCLNRITVLATDTLEEFARKVRGGLPRRLAWYARRARSRLRRMLNA
jgi:peptidoglycan/xylan/chitin deacetylase (PgdA/CDA1 family)